MGPRAGLGDVEKRKILPLTGLELRPLALPAIRAPIIFGNMIKYTMYNCGSTGSRKERIYFLTIYLTFNIQKLSDHKSYTELNKKEMSSIP
jgi:hypothetical protein